MCAQRSNCHIGYSVGQTDGRTYRQKDTQSDLRCRFEPKKYIHILLLKIIYIVTISFNLKFSTLFVCRSTLFVNTSGDTIKILVFLCVCCTIGPLNVLWNLLFISVLIIQHQICFVDQKQVSKDVFEQKKMRQDPL